MGIEWEDDTEDYTRDDRSCCICECEGDEDSSWIFSECRGKYENHSTAEER